MSAGGGPSSLQTEWARLLLGALRRAGVRDAVLSPGSRNTPFTWAALREEGLRCRTIIDERSAGFFAVGHAKMTGRPVLLVCTSGSAAANYWPAVVEASESGTPLVLLTADRPLELQHAAAPQTIDQVRLYGAFARGYFELGSPDATPAMLRAVSRVAAQAVAAARSPEPGPVQINARARKPLEPHTGEDDAARRLTGAVDDLLAAVPAVYDALPAAPADGIDALADACRRARRGLIVCGPESPWRAPSPEDVGALAQVTGFAVVAEPASQQRFGALAGDDRVAMVDRFTALLTSARFRDGYGPDLIIQLGRPPTAAEWNRYLKRWEAAERWIIAPDGWSDPRGSATGWIRSPVGAAVRALADALGDSAFEASHRSAPERDAWRQRLMDANAVAAESIAGVLEGGFSEASAIRAVVDAVPRGGILALGNSLPIRETELFAAAADRGIAVWSQRGANGIDGVVSGAAGAAAATGRPTTLLIGDVSFTHDVGGLAAARGLDAPLTVVVLNNAGGRIFERLPLADLLEGDDAFQAWLTPPGIDIAAAARTFGARHVRAGSAEELRRTLAPGDDGAAAPPDRGLDAVVVEVLVPEGTTLERHRDMVDRLDERLRA